MDLIYMNEKKEDVGVVHDATLDLAFGADENDYECKIASVNHCCKEGYYLYFESTEYGGIVDDIYIDTDADEITYSGKTWHGIMNAKVLEPLKETDESGGGVTVHKGGKNLINQVCITASEAKKHFLNAGTYTVSKDESEVGNNWYFSAYDKNNNIITLDVIALADYQNYQISSTREYYYGATNSKSVTFTIETNCYIRIGSLNGSGNTYLMLNVGTTALPYEPYKSILNEYLMLSGDANAVIEWLVQRMGLSALFKASKDASGINVRTYKMDRYIKGYDGIRKMLKASGAKLNIAFKDGFVELSARPIVDYSKDEQFDTDQISFKIKKRYHPLNHVICLGKGDLAEREVIHVYADASGNISETQVFFGIDEVSATYENTNAQNSEELRQGGVERIQESWASNEIDFDFNADDYAYDIGDIVGAKERLTGIEVNAEITKKIVKIQNNTTTISYKVGE